MKHLLLIALLLVGTSLCVVGQKRDTVKELMALEDRFNAALLRGDWKALESIEADDLIFTNADGSVSHKADTIDSLKSRDMKFDSISMSNVVIQDFGIVGVVTGELVEKARYKDTDLSGTYRFTDVWVKRKGRWQHVTGQETRYK
jgi:ketosteroid isomerase-like protein